MMNFTKRSPMPASAETLYHWHANPAGFFRLMPPWENLRIIAQEGPFGDGHTVTIRTPILGPIKKNWLAKLFDVRPGVQFRDVQLHGPFAEWTHTHRMIATGPGTSELEDQIDYQLPFGWLGRLFGGGLVRRQLEQLFQYRHFITASDLKRIAQFQQVPRQKVAITGATGLVGQELARFLTVAGHRVLGLTRSQPKPRPFDDGTVQLQWNPLDPNPELFEGVDTVVHLAGENIADGRWTPARKQLLRDSRIGPTQKLAEVLAHCRNGPKTLISASGIGIYGDRGSERLTESSTLGSDFIAQLAREWEAATEPAQQAGLRVVQLRLGIVLSAKGGALAKQLLAFKLGQGAMLGSGEQFISWIGLNDLLGVIHHVMLTPTVRGPLNTATMNPVTNREFGRVLAKVLRRPYLLTVPRLALRLLFGELADAALLASQNADVGKLLASGFIFDHPDLESALRFNLGVF